MTRGWPGVGRPGRQHEVYDPGLLEFSVEIIADAIRSASQPGAPVEIKKETWRRSSFDWSGRCVGSGRRNGPGVKGQAGVADRPDGAVSGFGAKVMAFLKRANGEAAGQIIELKQDRTVIGRSPEHATSSSTPTASAAGTPRSTRRGTTSSLPTSTPGT